MLFSPSDRLAVRILPFHLENSMVSRAWSESVISTTGLPHRLRGESSLRLTPSTSTQGIVCRDRFLARKPSGDRISTGSSRREPCLIDRHRMKGSKAQATSVRISKPGWCLVLVQDATSRNTQKPVTTTAEISSRQGLVNILIVCRVSKPTTTLARRLASLISWAWSRSDMAGTRKQPAPWQQDSFVPPLVLELRANHL